jgi:hypothetical protein
MTVADLVSARGITRVEPAPVEPAPADPAPVAEPVPAGADPAPEAVAAAPDPDPAGPVDRTAAQDPAPDGPGPPPSDPDLLAPPWARPFAALDADDDPGGGEPDAGPDGTGPDPAAATDRLRPARAPARSAPAAGRPSRFSVPPRPPVVDDLAITGLTRRSNSTWGSRLFKLFFAVVYVVILLQLIDSLLHPIYR